MERVGRHDNFFELGGHSLLALKAVSQQLTGLSVTDLFTNPTIQTLAQRATRNNAGQLLHTSALPIRTTGDSTPLFLFHDFFGDAFYFPLLAKWIDTNTPVYGLSGMPITEKQLTTMEDLASRMIAMIQTVQPNGPYNLAGWSFGGIVAYETALQLERKGEKVQFLGLIDAHYEFAPTIKFVVIRIIDDCLRGLTAIDERLPRLCVRENLRRHVGALGFAEVWTICHTEGLLPPHLAAMDIIGVRQYVTRLDAHQAALTSYTPSPIEARVHLLVADEYPSGRATSTSALGWDRMVAGDQLALIRIPGNHQTMISRYVSELGRAMSKAIENSWSVRR